MANIILTPNMNLPNPVPGSDPGPDYASNIETSFNILDQHNHAPPNGGVQINPDGININSDLPFNDHQATGLKSVLFTDQTSLATLNALYTINGELWFNDATNPVQITLGGNVNATSSGISDGSGNTAAFNTGVLVVQNVSTAPDSVQCGSILLGNTGTPSSGFVTISPPASTATYSLTLPTIPVFNSFLTIDTSGNISTSPNITAVQIAGHAIQQAQLQLRAVSSTVAAGGYAVSASTGNYTTGSLTPVAVTNLSVTVTTTGRPVQLRLSSSSVTPSNPGWVGLNTSGSTQPRASISFLSGSTILSSSMLGINGNEFNLIPPSSFACTDFPAAGTYTYTVQANVLGGGGDYTVFVTNCQLEAYEI